MTHIKQLIDAADPMIPFRSRSEADDFLQQYSLDDQAALVSALYIGRDHIHYNALNDDCFNAGIEFNRFFHTGGDGDVRWLIEPSEFKDILYEKNTNLQTYYKAFLRCANGSELDLSSF